MMKIFNPWLTVLGIELTWQQLASFLISEFDHSKICKLHMQMFTSLVMKTEEVIKYFYHTWGSIVFCKKINTYTQTSRSKPACNNWKLT